jgi:hypothetical protein
VLEALPLMPMCVASAFNADILAAVSSGVVVPLISAGGTVVAAIVTGFFAAGLKHRWDTKAEDLRWAREREERRRDEVRVALAEFFAAFRRCIDTGNGAYARGITDHRARGGEEATPEDWGRMNVALVNDPKFMTNLIGLAAARDQLLVLVSDDEGSPFHEAADTMHGWIADCHQAGVKGEHMPPSNVKDLDRLVAWAREFLSHT